MLRIRINGLSTKKSASPIILGKKQQILMRFTVNHRQLNAITKIDTDITSLLELRKRFLLNVLGKNTRNVQPFPRFSLSIHRNGKRMKEMHSSIR